METSNTGKKRVLEGNSPLGDSEHKIELIKGFSKLDRAQRIEVINSFLGEDLSAQLDEFIHSNPNYQSAFSDFIENYLSNYILPFGVVPNVLINNQVFLVPMVVEESSVVAAASRSAGFWAKNGGFKTTVIGTIKKGQVHFLWSGSFAFLQDNLAGIKNKIFEATKPITVSMEKRGGGIVGIELLDFTSKLDHYYQLDISFETADAMGANFINTCLETIAVIFSEHFDDFKSDGDLDIIMAILSNHTPECIVNCEVECDIDALLPFSGRFNASTFAKRFKLAVDMANASVSRAVTHNKGIYNGVDGVVLATGNDWRAIEAAGHAYAAETGHYKSLSEVEINNNKFSYSIQLPLALGTVGGLTSSHPLAKFALKMMGNPSASKLMEIAASIGMANNFSAISSLVTSGIQKGHMKMHLSNILNQLGASSLQKEKAIEWFAGRTVSYSAVEQFLQNNHNH